MAAKTYTTSMGELTTKDVTAIRKSVGELLAVGALDNYLDSIAEQIIARGDVLVPDPEKKTTAPKKVAEKKTETRLPTAPTATKKKTETTDAPAVVVVENRNYTFPGEKLAGVVGKYLGASKRAGAGRFKVVVSTVDAYPVGKVIVVKSDTAKPTRQGPRS